MQILLLARRLGSGHGAYWILLLAALCLTLAPRAEAQFQITRWTVDTGGSSAMTSATYTLSGTAGQYDAGRSSAGTYEVLGGFWGARGALIVAVPVPEGPDAEGARFQLRSFPPTPNPAGTATQIRFELPDTRRVRIRIFNVHGELVREVTDAPQSAGRHLVVWDSRGSSSRPVSSGVYFVRVELGKVTTTHRLILLR
jgi:hypothetical protein